MSKIMQHCFLKKYKKRLFLIHIFVTIIFSDSYAATVTEAVQNYLDANPGHTIANLISFGRALNLANKNITDLTGLDTLDDDFGLNYAAITYLTLNGNFVAFIPANIFSKFGNLTTLAFIINGVPLVLNPGCFNGLSNLQYLELGQNNISAIPAEVFDPLTALVRLDLDRNDITTVPSGVFNNLSNLTILHFYANELTTLSSDTFDGLTALTTLDLSNNMVTELPAGIFDSQTNINTLNLQNNNIKNIPEGVFNNIPGEANIGLLDNPFVFQLKQSDQDAIINGNIGPALAAAIMVNNPISSFPCSTIAGIRRYAQATNSNMGY